MPPNPHPLDYRAVLAQIVLDHPNGGVDLEKELGRRFMGAGGMAGDLPPTPDPTPQPMGPYDQADLSTEALTQPIAASQPGARMDPGGLGDRMLGLPARVIPAGGLPDDTAQPTTAQPPDGTVPLNQATPAAPQQPQPHVPRGTGGTGDASTREEARDMALKRSGEQAQATVAGQEGLATSAAENDLAQKQLAVAQSGQAFQNIAQQKMQHYAALQEQMIQASLGQPDPKAYWANKSTFDRVLSKISLVLGGVGGGLTGQGNTSPIASAIQQNILAQKEQFERYGNAANQYGKMFEQFLAAGMDATTAAKNTVSTMDLMGVHQVKAIADRFAPQRGAAAIDSHLADFGQNEMAKTATAQKDRADAAKSYADAAKTKIEAAQLGMGHMVRDLDGNIGFALGPDAEKDKTGYLDETADYSNLLAAAKRIKALRQGGVGAIAHNKSALQLEALSLNQSLLGASSKPGMLSARTEAIAKEAAGDPARYFAITPSQDVDRRLDAIVDDAYAGAGRAEQRHGIYFNRPPPSNRTPWK